MSSGLVMSMSEDVVGGGDLVHSKRGGVSGLSAQALLNSSPIHDGTVLKLHVPLMYHILPSFIKRFVPTISDSSSSSKRNFCRFMSPKWKERELILLGSYIYRFNNHQSTSPKGSPIELNGLNAFIVDSNGDVKGAGFTDDMFMDDGGIGLDYVLMKSSLPPGVDTVFCLASFGKQKFYATKSREDAVAWVNSINQARQEAITRRMGHSKTPVPSNWKTFDTLAKDLVTRKERIKTRMNDTSRREMEMTAMNITG